MVYFWHMVGNRFLTLLSNMLTNLNLTDMETCYKVFRREVLADIVIEEDRFGFEPEITAKVAGSRCRVFEVGISYNGRTYEEGKKIGWRDGFRALYVIVKYNVFKRNKRSKQAWQVNTQGRSPPSTRKRAQLQRLPDRSGAPAAPSRDLIDFGAGIGTFSRRLRDAGYNVVCIEPDGLQRANVARPRFGGLSRYRLGAR